MLDFTIASASLLFFNIWTYTLTRVWYLSIYTIVAFWSVYCLGLIVLGFSTSGRLENKNDWLPFVDNSLGNTIEIHPHTKRQDIVRGEHRLLLISWPSYANGMPWWRKHFS